VLEKANLSAKQPKPAVKQLDDIPEASREQPAARQRAWLNPLLWLSGGLGIGAIAVLTSILFISQISQQEVVSATGDRGSEPTAQPSPRQTVPSPPQKSESDPKVILPSPTPVTRPTANASHTVENSPNLPPRPAEAISPQVAVENLLGHLRYQQAPETELQAVSSDGRIQLRRTAAQKFQEMSATARSQGIVLSPLSGFRTVEEQQYLFFEIKAQRNQDARKRAAVSAPPGYSEHHTGYAIDIGDGKVPATNLQVSFEKTAAFQWLEQNAPRYGFELSFPRDNPQGISYEPWHWRFVGDIHSLETFYRAQNLPK